MVGELIALAQVGTLAGSNVAAGASSRRSSAEATLLLASPVALLVVFVPILAVGTTWSVPAVGAGVVAGTSGGLGLLLAYRAFRGGAVGVVVPMITCVTTVVVTVVGSVLDAAPSPSAWAGALICVVAVVVLTRGGTAPGGDAGVRPDSTRRSILLSSAAGTGFAAFVLVVSAIDRAENLAGLAAARICVLAVAVVAVLVTRRAGTASRPPVWVTAVAGALDASGNLLLLAALADVPVALVGALSAAGPAVAALLGRIVLREELRPNQVLGIAIACLGALVVVVG